MVAEVRKITQVMGTIEMVAEGGMGTIETVAEVMATISATAALPEPPV